MKPRVRVWGTLYWAAPPALCLILYWPGLRAWFQQDDFAWLGLGLSVKGPGDLAHALFAPMAQGTIRPLSERAFFLVMHALFGLWSAPYRACVFLTQFANLALVSWICRRLTGSALAGFLAPVLWVFCGALVIPLSWTSAWNQLLCGFFLLAAFACLLRYLETGRRAWLAGEWAAFLLGLGSLELAVLYPALVAAYCLCCARRHWRSALPFFAASTLYTALHFWAARPPADPAYAPVFGISMLGSLATYWGWALNVTRLPEFIILPAWAVQAAFWLLTAGVVGFAVWQIRRRGLLPLFFLLWFLVLLAPVLPLTNHVSDYYLTLPAVGLTMLGAWGLAKGWHAGWAGRAVALVLGALFAAAGAAEGRLGAQAVAERSYRVRTLVWGVAHARQVHPDKALVLTGITDELFRIGLLHHPFRLVGVREVFLAPGDAAAIEAPPDKLAPFVMPPGLLLLAIESDHALVYAAEERHLRAVTWPYLVEARSRWRPEIPTRIDVGQVAFSALLGPSWYNAESGRRWMPKRATLWLGSPRTSRSRLFLSGYCPEAEVAQGSLRLKLAADGEPLPELLISKGNSQFEFALPLPAALAGKPRFELSLEVDRTFRAPGDLRELGLLFGTFEIRE